MKEKENNYHIQKLTGYQIRSKMPHFEEGEADISYFSRLEKRKGEENLIYALEDENGNIHEGTDAVKKQIHTFYKSLYTKEPESYEAMEELLNNINTQITENDKQYLDSPIIASEVKDALDNISLNKSPGLDGLTKEFYETFWEELEPFYEQVINEIFETGEQTNLQKKGLVKILYKKKW